MFTFKNKSIQVYLDGPTLEEMKTADENLIDGYTFNPTLFKNLNAKNYINFSKKILSLNKNKPVSLEIINFALFIKEIKVLILIDSPLSTTTLPFNLSASLISFGPGAKSIGYLFL